MTEDEWNDLQVGDLIRAKNGSEGYVIGRGIREVTKIVRGEGVEVTAIHYRRITGEWPKRDYLTSIGGPSFFLDNLDYLGPPTPEDVLEDVRSRLEENLREGR